jgi:hypothetical protein
MTALAACLGAVLGLPIAWSMAEPAGAVVEAAVSKVQNLADLLGQRSPGTRTEGQLTKIKHARIASKVPAPRTPVAPTGHKDAPNVPTAAALVDLLLPPIVPVEIASDGSQPPFAPPPTLGTLLASAPGGPAFTPPGDGGGTVTFPSSEPREELPPTSAVPEPGTWATMLLGFGLIAWRVRRRRPSAAKATRAAL